MECNKDEAIRAKELAQKKMHNNDFDGAQKIALKAQQLFPDLENITHLLAVCHVHCSSRRILGSEKDWYSILQVERLADEVTIKKQYRKLALLLHPDKNKFPGAEAAFKLIGEAHLVLSDRGKRSLYDGKIGISFKSAQAKPPPHQVNKNPSTWKQPAVQNNLNGFGTQFSGLNQHKTTQSNSSVSQESFWTCCPFCNVKYQYYRNFVNRALRCQKCSKPFIAYDIAAQGVPPGTKKSQAATQGVPPRSNWSQPSVSHQKEFPVPGSHKTGTQTPAGFPVSSSGSQRAAGSRSMGSDSGSQMRGATEVGSDLKTQETESNMGSGMEGVATSKVESVKKPREGPNVGNKKRKRGSKLEAESGESSDTLSDTDSEDIIIEESVSDPAAGPNSRVNGFHERRRSSRQKHNVSYLESEGDDDDLESPTKRTRDGISSSGSKGQQEGIFDADPHCANPLKQDSVSSKVNSSKKKFQACKIQMQEASASFDCEKVEIIDDDSETDANATNDPCLVFNCPDPEFNDFDKCREESCFAADQFWACYDPVDGMPRFYAHIRKVYSGGFKVRITWLEPDPDEESEICWVNGELPTACGKFRRGKSEDTTNRLTFSHQVLYEKGGKRGSFMIYPKKGEVWALFKDWDIKWSNDPENHKKFKYEIVEVISDFVEGAGITVAFLYKVRGFVCLFHRRNERSESIVILPNELFRFSHKIPSFKMSGTEKGVPEGCFELDPASLPLNPDDLCSPFMAKDGAKNSHAKANCVFQNSSPIKSKLRTSESESTPKKSDLFKGKNCFDRETCVLRRSPRGLNQPDQVLEL